MLKVHNTKRIFIHFCSLFQTFTFFEMDKIYNNAGLLIEVTGNVNANKTSKKNVFACLRDSLEYILK